MAGYPIMIWLGFYCSASGRHEKREKWECEAALDEPEVKGWGTIDLQFLILHSNGLSKYGKKYMHAMLGWSFRKYLSVKFWLKSPIQAIVYRLRIWLKPKLRLKHIRELRPSEEWCLWSYELTCMAQEMERKSRGQENNKCAAFIVCFFFLFWDYLWFNNFVINAGAKCLMLMVPLRSHKRHM